MSAKPDESPYFETERVLTAQMVALAEAKAGESGAVTDALLMEEIGWVLAHAYPGRGASILEVKAAVAGDVSEGCRLRSELTMLHPGELAELRVNVSSSGRTLMVAHLTVRLPSVTSEASSGVLDPNNMRAYMP